MYVYSQREDIAVAVELKLTKWSRALEQALLYQLCSDLVYIAMPQSEIKRVDLRALGEHGIGLIAVGEERCKEMLRAAPSEVVRKHYREEYLTMLRED
jgi:hypothetical protein